MRIVALLLLLMTAMIGSGCNSCNDTPDPTGDDDDASEPGDDDETPVSGTLEPLPTPTPLSDPLAEIKVWPSAATIAVGDTLTFVARGYLKSGLEEDVPMVWASLDDAIATVDDAGQVVGLSAGTTFITATGEDMVSPAVAVEVVDPGNLMIRVVDANTKESIGNAEVYLGVDPVTAFTTDEQGELFLEDMADELSGPVTVTAYHPDYHYATIFNTRSRELQIPLRSVASTSEGQFSGTADFSMMSKRSVDDIRIGLITRSFFGNPLSLDTSTIIGNMRKVDVCNIGLDLPSNIVGEAVCADIMDYIVPGHTGTYDAYMLAGDLALQTLMDWIEEDPEIFLNLGKMLMLIPDLYAFSYEYLQDIEIEAPNDSSGHAAIPDGYTNVAMTIDVPIMPSGISGEYPPVTFAIADLGEERGYLPIGVGGALGGTTGTVYHPAEFLDRPLYGMILASAVGVGDDGQYVAVMAEQTDPGESVKPPDFLALMQHNTEGIDVAARTFAFYPINNVSVYRTTFAYRFKNRLQGSIQKKIWWDMYQPTDQLTTTIPHIPTDPEILYAEEWILKALDWEFFGYDNGRLTFEIFASDPSLTLYDSSTLLERISRNKFYDVDDYL